MHHKAEMENRCISVHEVAKLLNMGVSTVWYRLKRDEDFPKPFKLGPRKTVWRLNEVEAYIRRQQERYRNRREKA